MTEGEHGTKENEDVLDFLDGVLDDATKAKEDDGKISGFEAATIAIQNAPEAVTAWQGKEHIDDEWKDASPEEMRHLLARYAATTQKFVRLLGLGGES